MNTHKFLLVLLFLSPVAGFAQENRALNQLQAAVDDYSVKIKKCNVSRNENDLSILDIKEIKDIVMRSPVVLSYLSEKSFNNCLQPERGLLAEAILYASTKDTSSSTFTLAESIRKTSFQPDFSGEIIFHELTAEQQKKLLSIDKLKVPFDALELMDKVIDE